MGRLNEYDDVERKVIEPTRCIVIDDPVIKTIPSIEGSNTTMTPSDFYILLHSIQSHEIEVCHQGQAEYANDPDNVFANFDRISTQLGLTREQVLLVYALKHWDGIVSYVNGHRSQREDIRGRIKDLRMYLALLWGMVEESGEERS